MLHSLSTTFICLILLIVGGGCGRKSSNLSEDGRPVVTLWTSWAGTERAGIDAVIDDFNQAQDSFFVRSLNITDPQTKIMLATAGGNPPDIAIMGNQYIPVYVENNALTPLDGLLENAAIDASQFVPTFWKTARYRQHTWAIPLTCSVTALHYNKKLFAEVGLDPESPPQTIEELERINDRITQYREDGSIARMGHFPLEPGWWRPEWSNWFGAGSFDGNEKMLYQDDGWRRAADWMVSYDERFGGEKLIKMRSGFGRFSSPQNPFFAGRVAIILQGIWMDKFIETFADPDFEYGVAPFPASKESGKPYYSVADVDLAVIPTGAKQIEGAFAFMRYLIQDGAVETLALAHGKMTALREVSANFKANHPHPYLETFIEIANSGYAQPRPQLTQFQSYFNDTNELVNALVFGMKDKDSALDEIQQRQQATLDKKTLRWSRVSQSYEESWQKEIDQQIAQP